MSVRDRKRVLAATWRVRGTIENLLRNVEIATSLPWRTYDPAEYEGDDALVGAQIAAEVRVHWRIQPGPIRNLTSFVEAAGVVVHALPLHEQVDALTWTTIQPRVILLADNRPGCRRRLSLAHELAHQVMEHLSDHKKTDAQAKAFALSLLLPDDDFTESWPSLLSGDSLGRLKQHWGVSMQAMLIRARNLRLIDERVYQNWAVAFSRNGWRKNEPVAINIEMPTMLRDVIDAHVSRLGYTLPELAEAYGWTLDEYSERMVRSRTVTAVVRPESPALAPIPTQRVSNIISMPLHSTSRKSD